MNYYKRLSSGKYVDLANIGDEDIDLEDITVSLNEMKRFNGHWGEGGQPPLTIAQHSALCETLSTQLFGHNERLERACFIHDFAEAYYGDVITPVKKIMGQAWKDFANPIDEAVERKFWSFVEPITEEERQQVKICDLMSLDIERRVMWKSQYGKKYWPETLSMKYTLKDKEKLFHRFSASYYDFKEML